MRTPLFIDENGDLMAFDTAAHASLALEALDVECGIYVGFDAEGAPLRMRTAHERSGRRIVVIETTPEPRRDEFQALLSSRLQKAGVAPASQDLDSLVKTARDLFLTR